MAEDLPRILTDRTAASTQAAAETIAHYATSFEAIQRGLDLAIDLLRLQTLALYVLQARDSEIPLIEAETSRLTAKRNGRMQ